MLVNGRYHAQIIFIDEGAMQRAVARRTLTVDLSDFALDVGRAARHGEGDVWSRIERGPNGEDEIVEIDPLRGLPPSLIAAALRDETIIPVVSLPDDLLEQIRQERAQCSLDIEPSIPSSGVYGIVVAPGRYRIVKTEKKAA